MPKQRVARIGTEYHRGIEWDRAAEGYRRARNPFDEDIRAVLGLPAPAGDGRRTAACADVRVNAGRKSDSSAG